MARLQRIAPKDVPIHILARGNNRQLCFGSEDDHAAYTGWLAEYAKRYRVDVHAWVLMTNHVHLLCTPRPEYMELIQNASNKGKVVDSDGFLTGIEALTGRRLREKKRGRPMGWQKA